MRQFGNLANIDYTLWSLSKFALILQVTSVQSWACFANCLKFRRSLDWRQEQRTSLA